MRAILTNDHIGLRRLLLNQSHIIQVTQDNSNFGICLGDGVCFGTITQENTALVFGVRRLEDVKNFPTNVARGACTKGKSVYDKPTSDHSGTNRKIRAILIKSISFFQ